MKKGISLILTAAMLCSAITPVAAAETDSKVLNIGLNTDVESFNPWLGPSSGREQGDYYSVYETLANLTPAGERELILAKNVESAGEGSYEIELYDYITDSKGRSITASDVVFSYEQCMATGQMAWALRYLDHFEIEDDYHLIMYTVDESAVALDMLLKSCMIVSEESYNESDDGMAVDPVGTGRYILDSYTPGSSATFSVREDYWQTDEDQVFISAKLGDVEKINLQFISDTATLALALEMGSIDYSGTVNTTDYGLFMDEEGNALDGYVVESVLNPLVYILMYNCGEKSPLQDQRVREAVSYAIDMEAVKTNIYGNTAEVATTQSSPWYNDYDESLNETIPYAYDPEKAKELLEEAGYNSGNPLSLKLMVQNDQSYTQAATLFQAYLQGVGVSVDIIEYDNALFTSTMNDRNGDQWDICFNATMGLNTPGRLSTLDKNAYDTGLNGLYLDDDTLQELYLKANLAGTYSKETVTDLLTYIDENCYEYPCFYQTTYLIATDKIASFGYDRNHALIYGSVEFAE